uniref:FAD-dependent oxidoreductase n=2 Tax=Cohnella candidum TaxID=2674991 RepID=A0A3G3K4S6_9BACL|nr:FAD-dependent oxidoreductase [Cohnella candidum]
MSRNAEAASDPTHPDIAIIGSEIEGMYLARAAADEGLSVVVLDPRPKPGGQLLEGEMLFLDEPLGDNGQVLLQGRMKELFDAFKNGKIRKISEFRAYYDKLVKGIPMESGITLTGVDVRQDPDATGRFVDSVAYRTKNGEEKTVYPRYVVENTDYAALTSQLGLRRIPGMETVFGSPDGSPDYMAASLMLKFKNVDWAVFQKEVMKLSKAQREAKYGSETFVNTTFTWGFGKVGAGYDSGSDEWFLRGLNTVNQRDGEVLINALLVYGVNPSDEASVRRAVEEGKTQTQRIVSYLRKTLPGWSKAEVNGYPDYLYIRDFDRYETEYVLQGTDLMSGRMYWDNVSIGGYEIDLQGTQNSKWGSRKGNPDKYGMPLRSFEAKGYKNVIVAGKNVGASAVAYGSARIQAQTALAAESIGIILGQIKGKYELADMTPDRMKVLQDYIAKKYRITLTGVKANDKTKGLTAAQRELFNQGKLVIP